VKLKVEQLSLPLVDLSQPVKEGFLRVVCLSDTHNKHDQLEVPLGDVLVHAGDFSSTGTPDQLQRFAEFMAAQPHKHKLVIAGNHDVILDLAKYERTLCKRFHERLCAKEPVDAAAVKSSFASGEAFTYLEEQLVEIEGVRFYGSPHSPAFHDWAFGPERGPESRAVWSRVPEKVDVLVTHGPPLGYGDLCRSGNRAGCYSLLCAVHRVRPSFHVFGHVHEGAGVFSDGTTTFINASNCDFFYRATNPPIVFDIRKPAL